MGSFWCAAGGKFLLNSLVTSLGAIVWNLINSIITGATGEETGWRGYLHPIFTKKYGVVKGSVCVGIIWGFWHTPLWFLTSGYAGVQLIQYSACFMIFIVSAAVVMGICYEKNRNILIPVGIHFGVNFTLGFYNGDLLTLIKYLMILYLLWAVIMTISSNNKRKLMEL